MSVTAYKGPTADGQIIDAWNNPQYAYTIDVLYWAICSTWDPPTNAEDFYHFDFTSSDIPAGSAINGFEIEITGHNGTTACTTNMHCKMVKDSTHTYGDEYAYLSVFDSDETITVGSSTELFDTTWTQAEVVADTFGVKVWPVRITTSSWHACHINAVRIRVYYTKPTATVTAAQADLTYTIPTGRVTAGQADLTHSLKTGRVTAGQADLTYSQKTSRVTAAQADLTHSLKTGRVTASQADLTYTETGEPEPSPPIKPSGTFYYIKSGGNNASAGTSWATAWADTDKLHTLYPLPCPITSTDCIVIRSATYMPTLTVMIWKSQVTIVSEKQAVAYLWIDQDAEYINAVPVIDGTNILDNTGGRNPYSQDILALDVPGNRGGGVENDCHSFTLDGINLINGKRNGFWTSCVTGGTRAYNAFHEIRNSTISYCAATGVYGRQANDFYLHDVELHHNGDGVEAHLVHAVYLNDSDNVLIEDAIVRDTLNAGAIHLNGDKVSGVQGFMRNAIVRRSKFWNNKGVDIDLYNAIGGRVENNVIHTPLATTTHINSLIYVGVDASGVPFPQPSNGVEIVNNTLVCAATQNDAIRLGSSPGEAKNCVVFNNIAVTADGIAATSIISDSTDNHTIVPNSVVAYTTGNLTAWFVDPLNATLASRNYHLKVGGPFFNAGANSVYNSETGTVFAPLEDYDGLHRPQGAGFDTGAFEYPVAGPTVYGRVTAVNAVATYTELPWERASFAPLQTFQLEDYRIDFMSWAGARKDSVQRASGYNPLTFLDFKLNANGGCGDATIKLLRERVPGPPRAAQFGYLMEPGDVVDVWLHSWYFGDALLQWYQGVITKVEDPEGFGDTITIEARGIWDEILEKRLVTKYYEGKAINVMVADILADVAAESRISTSTAGIVVTSPYTIDDVELELTSVAAAIESLAAVQGNIQYGIDPSGVFYFKTLDATTKLTAQVGVNVSDYKKHGESNDVTNHYLLQAKQLVGGANLILSREDGVSIATYGRRTKIVQATGLQNISDLYRYGDMLLDESAEYKDHVDVEVTGDVYYLFPRGKCNVAKLDKTSLPLDIQSVRYTFEGNGKMTLGLGDAPVSTLSDEVKRISRNISVGKQTAMSNTKIEHTKSDEWTQTVRLDAGKQGNLTVYYDIFPDETGLDQARSHGYTFDSRRGFMRAGPELAPNSCSIQSQAIPIGVQVDTIRVYTNTNLNGMIDFNTGDDIRDYFTQPDSGLWAISDLGSYLYDTRDPAGSFLTFDGDKYIYPTIYFVRLTGFTQLPTPTGEVAWIIWNYHADDGIDPESYHYIKIYATATTGQFEMKTYDGSTHTLVNGPIASNDIGRIDLEVRHSGTGNTTAALYRRSTGALRGTLTGSLTSYAFRPPKLFNFGNPYGQQPWIVDSIGLTRLTKCDVYASRDGGTTWTLATIADGETVVDVDVSTQPAGSTICLKAVMQYPSRLNGWGWSAKTS